MSELRRIPVRRSLNRETLLLGAERELVLVTGLLAFTLIFVSMAIPIVILGLITWVMIIGILRTMAKADPILSKLYIRHLK
ncbi:MAG: VirB3 family type IV secretion system protein, partial [Candidatus Margulisbacteria bacterium]|nr:VirB3 family type IV secretion system protein [Candidatus Margulisiibacteriota bacterium]